MNFSDLKIKLALRKYSAKAGNFEEKVTGTAVGVILSSEEEGLKKSFLSLKEFSGEKNRELHFLFCVRPSENDISEGNYFSEEMISWNGNILEQEVLKFLKLNFKLLVVFAQENKMTNMVVP